MKAVVKQLEEDNAELRRQARHVVRGSAQVTHGVVCGVTWCPLTATSSPRRRSSATCARGPRVYRKR